MQHHLRFLREISLLFFVCLTCGCARVTAIRESYLPLYQQGAFPQAQAALTTTIEQKMPQRDFRKSGDAVWLLLERATVQFADGQIEAAVQDYALALEALDYYRQTALAELLGQTLITDEVSAYVGQDFEQVLARLYFALSLLQKGEESNAAALLRQAEDVQELKRQEYRKISATKDYLLIDNALAKYLFATLLEHRGDESNAKILYRQAGKLLGTSYVSDDLLRLEQSAKKRNQMATVLVIGHNGRAPHKVSVISPASIASGAALEIFLHSQKLPISLSSMGGIPVPEFVEIPGDLPVLLQASLGQEWKPLQTYYAVNAIARQQLQQELPMIVARGVARFLMRRGLVGITSHSNQQVGAILDLAMLMTNLATKADIRSWTTLPYRIDVARFDVSPGSYALQMIASGQANAAAQQLQLRSGDLCVVNAFYVSSALCRIHVPPAFLLAPPTVEPTATPPAAVSTIAK